jgi:hypothetical protein
MKVVFRGDHRWVLPARIFKVGAFSVEDWEGLESGSPVESRDI